MFHSDVLLIVWFSSVQLESRPDHTFDQLNEEVLECVALGHVVDVLPVATIVSSDCDVTDFEEGVLFSNRLLVGRTTRNSSGWPLSLVTPRTM